MKFMTLWTDDWLAGTHPLTPEQRGVFIALVCHFINKDRVIPDNDVHLARLCNMPTRPYRRVKEVLIKDDFLEIRDGHLWMEKASEQYEKDQRFSRSQAKKAKLKARSKVGNALNNKDSTSAGDLPPLPLPHSIKDTNVSLSDKGKSKNAKRRLPENWQPNGKSNEIGFAEGYTPDEIQWSADGFKDYFIGEGKLKTETGWNRAFYNWLRSEITRRAIRERRKGVTGRNDEGRKGFAQIAVSTAARMGRDT